MEKYLWKWYKVAGTPFYWEKGCDFSEAFYTWGTCNSSENVMDIRNTCLDSNKKILRESFGKARIPNANDPMKLLVKFQESPFEGQYNILYTDYEKYSFVGSNNNLWVLSRTPQVPKSDIKFILQKVKQFGYSPDSVITSSQMFI